MQRTEEPFSHTGVLGVARWDSLTTQGRETSHDAGWPPATGSYKGDRSRVWSCEGSAGFIVLLEDRDNITRSEGRDPTSVDGSQCS